MAPSIEQQYRQLLETVAFAARAHRGQLRKDKETPYVSHVFRVCLTVRDIFGITDPRVLMAALLHDTLEDTLTDFDELEERFGHEIAYWVAILSKDKRQEEKKREKAYVKQLLRAPWQVQVCKLGDLFDNLLDLVHVDPERQARTLHQAAALLKSLQANPSKELRRPLALVGQLYQEIQARFPPLSSAAPG